MYNRLTYLMTGVLACACAPGMATTQTSTSGGSESDTGTHLPAPCESYLDCRDEATPSSAADAHAEFGVDGSCWEDRSETECVDACELQLEQYGMSYPDIEACGPPPTDVTFSIGAADFADPSMLDIPPAYRPLANGDTLNLVRGGQGLLMLPIGFRGENFEVPEDPTDYTHPKMPIVNLWLDIEGYNIGVGGHFARIANYPVGFEPTGDGVLEHLYTAILVPDEFDGDVIYELDGLPGQLWVELRTYENPAVTREVEVVIAVGDGV